MSGIEAIGGIGATAATQTVGSAQLNALPQRTDAADFAALLAQGIGAVDAKVARADELVARFAVDDSVPVHQVTIALEEARLSVELAMQVRARLVEGYKELMNIQL
jgi:flagellar hook-basal body complex protein FliE